jgi:GTPase SAR1 family protein
VGFFDALQGPHLAGHFLLGDQMSIQETAPDAGLHLSENESEEGESLHRYSEAKMYLSDRIRRLRGILESQGSKQRANACLELQTKLAQDRFLLAVVGQFKRGKSSLLNAIMGRALLPTGILPLTSAITIVRYGPREKMIVRYREHSFEQQQPLSRLSDYVTENGNPSNCKNVENVRIEYPSPFLRRGVEFVDTPGIGSIIEANTATTMSFLPQCDAAVFITGIDSPLTSAELEFLQETRKWAARIFFIVNKIDLVSCQEKEELLGFVQSKICESTGGTHVRLYPVSARRGLEAKLTGNEREYQDSGIKALVDDLSHFLSGERWTFFLSSIAGKALVPLEQELAELEIQLRSAALAEHERTAWNQSFRRGLESISSARRRILEDLASSAVQRLHQYWSSHMDSFLAEQEQQLRCRLAATCRGKPWQTWGSVADAFGQEANFSVKNALGLRAEHQEGGALRIFNKVYADFAGQLSANLAEMRDLAAALLGLELKLPSDSRPTDVQDLALDKPWHAMAWHPLKFRLNRVLRAVPVPAGSKRFEKLLVAQLHTWLDAIQRSFADAVRKSIDRALEEIAHSINEEAHLAESRFLSPYEGAPTKNDTAGKPPSARLASFMKELNALEHDFAKFATDQAEATVGVSLVDDLKLQQPKAESADSVKEENINLKLDPEARRCPVCCHMEKILFGFLSRWQYRLATEPAAQTAFAAEGGFCALHAWQLEAYSSPHGLSIGLPQLCERISQDLGARSRTREPADQTQPPFPSYSSSCRVCAALTKAETSFCDSLAALLATEDGRKTYARTEGACLRHLERLVNRVPRDVAALLLRHASRRFLETAEDMRSYSLKRDTVSGRPVNDNEAYAYLRALNNLAGSRMLQAPMKMDNDI